MADIQELVLVVLVEDYVEWDNCRWTQKCMKKAMILKMMLVLIFGAEIDCVGAGLANSLERPVNCEFQELLNISNRLFLNLRNTSLIKL